MLPELLQPESGGIIPASNVVTPGTGWSLSRMVTVAVKSPTSVRPSDGSDNATANCSVGSSTRSSTRPIVSDANAAPGAKVSTPVAATL